MIRKLLTASLLLFAVLGAQTQTSPITLAQAEAIAVKNHPRIALAQNLAGAAVENVTIARAPLYPAINGEITGSEANHFSRIGAGYLATSALFNRFGQGIVVNQMVTDLGRTRNLIASSRLQAQAADQVTVATKYDVILGVNRAYFGALEADALLRVAGETLKARQVVADQIRGLATAQLKSQVDVSFAMINVEQAQLLLLQVQEQVSQSYTNLTRAMGEDRAVHHQLVEESTAMPELPPEDATLVQQAVDQRPELRELRLRLQAAQRFESAERDLKRPNVNLMGTGGFLPYFDQDPRTAPREYEGIALNVEIPIFNGHLFSARAAAAHDQSMAADQRVRDEFQQVQHDVQVAWDEANAARQRIPVTEKLLQESNLALQLAQGRYNLGLASIVEVTQAQLNVTEAQIRNVNARYEYRDAFSVLQYTMGNLR